MISKFKKRFWLAGGLIGVLAVAAATYLSIWSTGPREPEEKGLSQAGSSVATELLRPVKVYCVKPAEGAVRTYTGVVRPRRETDLGFRVPGKIVARLVEVGDHVAAGQVLARLDPVDYELAEKIADADLAAARAESSNAAKEESRFRELSRTGAASDSEVDRAIDGRKTADARVERATRALAQAKNRVAYCMLSSDVDGVVTSMPAEVGQVVGEGTPVARVAHSGDMEAVISLPENRADDAQGTATMNVWGEVGPAYVLSLRELSPSVDPMTRTYQARYTIHDPGVDVALGRTVTVQLRSSAIRAVAISASTDKSKTPTQFNTGTNDQFASPDGYFVPLTSLFDRDDKPAVWRVIGDRLEAVPTNILAFHADGAIVSGGVEAGDWIVAVGVQKVDAAMRVRPWEPK